MAIKSIKATDRELAEWYTKINSGEIKLPRFQRFEAWDRNRINGLLTVIVNNLPLGITLILNVGDESQFVDRYLETAPETGKRVTEHLLDGQQRLTAFWRMMNNNYDDLTFFVYIPEFALMDEWKKVSDEITGYCQTRWMNKGRQFPMWANNSSEILRRGLIPSNLLRPGDIQTEIDNWLNDALSEKMPSNSDPNFAVLYASYFKVRETIKTKITDLREIVAHYNLPFLALPSSTPKETALNVFIKMNTNSKPLSLYDIIVAEIEGVKGQSLHDLEADLDAKHENIKYYFDLSDLILSTSALLQDKIPNVRGQLDMDKSKMVDNWDKLEKGLLQMANFLESQGIYDQQRLPTNAVLGVIAALYTYIPDSGDERGTAEIILKKYIWRAFFTERYENSTASRAYYDFKILKAILKNTSKDDGTKYVLNDAPVFSNEYQLSTVEELKTVKWPKGENVRGRAILAITTLLGAYDFADGQKATRNHLTKREYHHIYPDSLLQEAKIESFLALNCGLITNTTNRNIGKKEPLKYLKERYEWTDEEIVNQRLKSHLIPIKELANGGYEGLTDTDKNIKISSDFDSFLTKRAQLVSKAVEELCSGRNIVYSEIFKMVEQESLVSTNE
jgi:hypothetical protein